ncbi:YqaJ viral recombinase family protein [Sessilibacter corallicola]|uniref:YqaJ viral recombinase family protein n=1 Tax=Sessilibacter corallicola TaxID=2904075 RepID=UPI001E472EEF|nr:YqaJ viral recombinase family protein [Sessilibacter corallicola]MCE2029246.1 YqaJ viral recombinase family protein [Sessilibacter corallicola]
MKILNLVQGTDSWKAARKNYRTASEASIIMGASKNVSRNELLTMKKTATEQEFSDWFQKNVLDKGHEVEKMARPIAEQIIGEELFPITAAADDDTMLASLDGSTMLGNIIWECKQWNQEKADHISQSNQVPTQDFWQVVHQLIVSEAEKCLYMVTDGEREVHVWFSLNNDDIATLLHGWEQFQYDLDNFEIKPEKEVAVADTTENFPTLFVDIEGAVKETNLETYKEAAAKRIKSISTDLKSDKDFANAESMVKFLTEKEKEVEAVKKQALAKTSSIDDLFNTIDYLKEEMRSKRLELDKLVKQRKKDIKLEIAQGAKKSIDEHIDSLNKELGGEATLPSISFDINSAMKNKRTIATLQSAADDEAARAKIEASKEFHRIKENIALINKAEHPALFQDKATLALKEKDHVVAEINLREARFRKEEAKRKEELAQEKSISQPEVVAAKKGSGFSSSKTSATKETSAPAFNSTPKPRDEKIFICVAEKFNVEFSIAKAWVLGIEKTTTAA